MPRFYDYYSECPANPYGATNPYGYMCGWWGMPAGWTDLDLYDYNRNFVLDDNEIEDIIRDNISADYGIPLSDENRIEVSVKDGVAKLTGEVNQPRSKPLAYADAYWSSGVVDVDNKITVKSRRRRGQERQERQARE